MADLSSLLTASRQLTAHIPRPDLPTVNLGLDQIEQQSRRLVPTAQAGPDQAKASYLLAQAQIDTSALGSQIANLNTQATFAPLQPIHDTDVAGFIRHAHEQSLVASIEEGRRETEAEFYRVLDERVRRGWELRKKKIFEELGIKAEVGSSLAASESTSRLNAFGRAQPKLAASRSVLGLSQAPTKQSMPMHQKMMTYDRVVAQLNTSRMAQVAIPILFQLRKIAESERSGPSTLFAYALDALLEITGEKPQLPYSHAQAHLLNNNASLERSFAKAYLGDQNSAAAQDLRERIVNGARQALELQYWNYVEETIQSQLTNASAGGDPLPAKRIRAFLSVKFYKTGRWEERLELVASQPLWAQIFYLVRTGNIDDALRVVMETERQLNDREPHFAQAFKAWAESADRRLPRQSRERLYTSYNSRIAFGPNVDPFKQALFKIIGRIEPHKKTVPLVTSTTEDWVWFQLAMVDEQEGAGLRELGDALESYGEKHFSGGVGGPGSPSALNNMSASVLGASVGSSSAVKKMTWARLLITCGLFEKAVAALYEHPELQIEAVHLAIALSYYGLLRVPLREESSDVDILTPTAKYPATLNFANLIERYIAQFQRTDPKEALQYAFCVATGSDRTSSTSSDYERKVSQEQLDLARQLVQGIIISCEGKWEELIGGTREDGTRFSGVLEHYLPLLRLSTAEEYHEVILKGAADICQESRRTLDAIRLYNLANARDTVIDCLAKALGDLLSEPGGGGDEGRELEKLAEDVIRSYASRGERTAASQNVIKLIKIRNAMEKYDAGELDTALQSIEASELLPLDGDVQTTTRKMEEFRAMDSVITRNLGEVLTLTMNILAGLHARTKTLTLPETERNARLARYRKQAKALMTFAGMQKYSLSSDVFTQLTRLEVRIAH